jgi:hypothetical protein
MITVFTIAYIKSIYDHLSNGSFLTLNRLKTICEATESIEEIAVI